MKRKSIDALEFARQGLGALYQMPSKNTLLSVLREAVRQKKPLLLSFVHVYNHFKDRDPSNPYVVFVKQQGNPYKAMLTAANEYSEFKTTRITYDPKFKSQYEGYAKQYGTTVQAIEDFLYATPVTPTIVTDPVTAGFGGSDLLSKKNLMIAGGAAAAIGLITVLLK